ncbi:MAG: hypothetical protein RLZZ293_492 [Pseudomonadota bacterium]
MAKYTVAVLGCGAIFNRHLAALQANQDEYKFIAYYDPNPECIAKWQTQLVEQYCYSNEEEVYLDERTNCVVILTPSYLHYQQAKQALIHKKNVIIEKPATFTSNELKELEQLAKSNQVEIFCVLQVRLNQSIAIVQQILQNKLLGDIRSTSLVQRWQRPINYFTGWRGNSTECGGVLFEFGIHYLDIMQYLLGVPQVVASKYYQTKFTNSQVEDSVYALLDFGSFGGTMEICLTAEPHNIEVSLIIMGSNGFIKLAGKSLDQITHAEFLTKELQNQYDEICSTILGHPIDNQVTIGACPHHPELYRQIVLNPQQFQLASTFNVINLINQINLSR